jgi:hypothetical protein|tara:strand:- start:1672 stop:1917 length:246 start_codon:yes stop_codon:yes gene_type:complete
LSKAFLSKAFQPRALANPFYNDFWQRVSEVPHGGASEKLAARQIAQSVKHADQSNADLTCAEPRYERELSVDSNSDAGIKD